MTTTHKAKQPQPVLSRAGIVTALHVLAALCAYLGLGRVSDYLGAHAGVISAVILAIAPLVVGFLARRHVTPTASPRNDAGEKLEPVRELVAAEVSNALTSVHIHGVNAVQASDELASVLDRVSTAAAELAPALGLSSGAGLAVEQALDDAETVFAAVAAAPEPTEPATAA